MDSVEMTKRGQEPVEHKKEYETPRVTTFGSVAKLTMGSHSHGLDATLGTQTRDKGNN